MIGFIRSLFESALKTNNSLEFAVITGCLRLSKESIFTGLNNLKVNSILDQRYAEYFGFEESEVKQLLEYYDLGEYFDTAKEWYDGYTFGDKDIYNPWSVMNYVDRLLTESDKYPRAEWVNSSSNSIIRKLVEDADADVRQDVETLMNGGSVEAYLDETVTYADLDNKRSNMWNFLFFTGYLKKIDSKNIDGDILYTLVIPNKEIYLCYRKIITAYFDVQKSKVDRSGLYKALLSRDADGFAEIITDLLNESISFFDRGESFYHGLLAGLMGNNKYYRLESNREIGDGRCDIILYHRNKLDNALIMELKVCKDSDVIERKCMEALKQINDKHYSREAESRGYRNIIKYGIAFDEKACGAICE
ncbi:MAG: AAA family ATPase [Clostridia bacterium]|nr:AAA family ATPase [Clostridia bacterium]